MQTPLEAQHDAQNDTTLEGLEASSWGGHVLLNHPLMLPARHGGNSVIESCVLYPLKPDQPPEQACIIPLDFGKRALKGGGVTNFGQFKSTIIVDAYSAAKHVQQDEDEEAGAAESIWRVMGPDKKMSETFRCGSRALRMAEALPVNESVAKRLKDVRVRNMTITAIVENLAAIGVRAMIDDDGIPVVKKHNVILPIGLPANDLNKSRIEETTKALAGLKGLYTIEQFDTKTGKTTTWMIEIVGIIPAPQPRGTHYTATKTLSGTSATRKKIITIIDIGGGDVYAYEVDSSSGTISDARRLGDGTIAIVRGEGGLINLVEERYGIAISEAQAQEALYTHTILKSGDEYDIADLMEQLQPRFDHLLTTVTITQRMLSTFVVFTGGGVALLHDQIHEKMRSGKQEEGKDYLIIPRAIAPIANCIGLFAHGYYKVQQEIRHTVSAYLQLREQQQLLRKTLEGLAQQPVRASEIQEELSRVQERLVRHPGQYYKALQQQLLLERQQQSQLR